MVTRRLLVVANEAPTVYVIRATNRCWKNVGTSLPFTTSSSQKQNTRIPIKRVVVQQIFANNGVSDAEATYRVDPCVRSARCVDGATTSRCSQTTVASKKNDVHLTLNLPACLFRPDKFPPTLNAYCNTSTAATVGLQRYTNPFKALQHKHRPRVTARRSPHARH